jgi:HSP20 family protein
MISSRRNQTVPASQIGYNVGHFPVSVGQYSVHPFVKFQQEMNHVMNDFYHFFGPIRAGYESSDSIRLLPLLDITEEKDCFKVQCEMPGMSEENVKVSCYENYLTIQGEKNTSKTNGKNNSYVTREISYGHYERTVTLPQSANCEKAVASFKKGVLWITVPKKAGSKTTTRTIKVERAK